MNNTEFAQKTYTKAARNLIRRAVVNLSVGNVEEGRILVRLAGEQLDRADCIDCEVIPFPRGTA